MDSLVARQLLSNAAMIAQKEKEDFSRLEIAKKVNEIKYLSAQKKVPRLTLRKEIIHLENNLKNVFDVEQRLLKQKNQENIKIESLKRQIQTLKNQLKVSADKDLSKKVERLSHLLAEHLARVNAAETVELTRKIVEETKKPDLKLDPETIERIKVLKGRLERLEHEISIHKELETKKPEEIKLIESKVSLIQDKLNSYYQKHPELLELEGFVKQVPSAKLLDQPKFEVKHEMAFPTTPIISKEIDEEMITEGVKAEELEFKLSADHLPLPPPPRVKKG
ncbi:MAG: hypothetical protein KKA62_00450 [Nanoarchaeota archaeon]|nr:hypothetical protein [Nanoarchaeota archaeon]MBU1643908.1 hypothetical protein [Nanoarchaeota archaeon]MBU1976406.1 hypothetical protein [Nanoarchaeota archaeon]